MKARTSRAASGRSARPASRMRRAEPGVRREKVVISGADLVTGWSVHSGQVYRAPMRWNLGDGFNQVFVNGKMMHLARWPNTGDDLLSPNLAEASASENTVTFSEKRPENYWIGGTVYGLFGVKWAAQGATITASSGRGNSSHHGRISGCRSRSRSV